MAGKPIEAKILENIKYLRDTVIKTTRGYNVDMSGLAVTYSAVEEKNEDQGDIEKFEGLGIPENRRAIKAGLYRNSLLFAIHVGFSPDKSWEDTAKVADDWKKAFGTYPQVNPPDFPSDIPPATVPNAVTGAFEAQYQKYVKTPGTGTEMFSAIDFYVQIRYRQRRNEPETAG